MKRRMSGMLEDCEDTDDEEEDEVESEDWCEGVIHFGGTLLELGTGRIRFCGVALVLWNR